MVATPEVAHPSGTGIETGTVSQDALASVVVFLVALPLCMGIAIASGVPISAGLITGIIGGIVVGSLAGCPLQVSGPAAGLTVIVYEAVQRFGLDLLGVIVLIAGILQILAGLGRIGTWFRAVSPAVVRGMLAGIGILILASQFHVMFDKIPQSSGLKNLLAIPSTVQDSLNAVTYPNAADRVSQKAQIAAMRKLQREQQTLRAKVLDRLTAAKQTPVDLASFAVEQAKITSSLQATTADLATAYQADQPRVATMQGLVADTLAATLESERILQTNDVEHVAAALGTAGAKFDSLFGAAKNNFLAAIIGLITIFMLIAWKALAPKKMQLIPPGLVAVLVGTGLAVALTMPILYVVVPESMRDEIRVPTWSLLESAPWGELLPAAILMAVVASAETLLCCTAVDQMQNGPRTKYDKELVAQGLGNFLCGLCGALPMTGVIVRSTANIQAGGTTRLSAILHGVWILIFVVALSKLLMLIPTACLAAILVYTGFKLIDLKAVKNLIQFGWSEVGIYAATVIVIVCKDLLSGVMVGFGLAIAKLLYTFSHLETQLETAPNGRSAALTLTGAATFVRLPQLAKAIETIPRGTEIHVNLNGLDYIDHACLDLLMTWAKQHESSGGQVNIDWDSLHFMLRRTPHDKMATKGNAVPARAT